MSTEREAFGDYIRRIALEKSLTYREIARRGGISAPSISDIISGKTKEVKASTISALAKGLGVPEEDVYAAYRGKSAATDTDSPEDGELAALFYEYKDLTEEDKEELRTVMEMVRQEIRRRKQAGELVSQRKAREKASKRR